MVLRVGLQSLLARAVGTVPCALEVETAARRAPRIEVPTGTCERDRCVTLGHAIVLPLGADLGISSAAVADHAHVSALHDRERH